MLFRLRSVKNEVNTQKLLSFSRKAIQFEALSVIKVKSREQRAESREQRAESREQRAESGEQLATQSQL